MDELQKIIKSDMSNSEQMKKLKTLSAKEKECKRRMKRQCNKDLELYNKRSDLERELYEINEELKVIALNECYNED